MHKLIAGAAVIALAATTAQADPGKNKGNGGDRGNPAAQMKGGGSAKADRGQVAKFDRGPARADRGPAKDKNSERRFEQAQRADKYDRKVDRRIDRRDDDRVFVERRNGDRDRQSDRVVKVAFDRNSGLIGGCPPGLAKKNNGCMPPGLLRDRRGDSDFRQAFYRSDWWGQSSLGNRVYYDDGYLYRMGSNNNVLGYIPLLGGALSVGNPWPSFYEPMQVPDYYTDYYNLGPSGSYRYADDVLYRVDPESSAITAIAALLTGDDFTVGQPMPSGYDVYNVPYAYRDRYNDTPEARYRYADGYVYRVDPKTQLIAAAIQLLS